MPEANPVDDRPADALEPDEPDHGPHFEVEEPVPLEGGVDETQVAAFWEDFGTILNRFLPTPEWAPDAWLLSPTEVRQLTVPSVTIANARAPMLSAAVVKHSAEAALGIHLIAYVKSNAAKIRPPDEEGPPPVFPEARDFDAETGEPVVAPAAGVVITAPAGPEPPGEDVIDPLNRPYFEQGNL